MLSVQFSHPDFKIKYKNGTPYVFDIIRKRWIKITPEEWVRQNFVNWLIIKKKIPKAYIAVEKQIALYDLKKRFDILVYNKNFEPWIIVECKSDKIILTNDTLLQALNYHIAIPVPFIIITNGLVSFLFKKKNKKMIAYRNFPTHK